jgi:hypothetical protein
VCVVIASKACSGLTPLRCGFWWAGLRGIRPLRAEEALGRIGFRALREVCVVIASKACSGPIPLRCGFWWAGLRGIRPLLAEEALQG